MTTATESMAVRPVNKSITVKASAERAFRVFTEGIDTWWPRSHHIGKSPMKKAVIEERVGGRCFTQQIDGTDCDWGQIVVWDPPHRFVIAWQVTPAWGYEPDLAKSSEVEVRFTQEADGVTRVDLEHRHFERHGDGAQAMRDGVDTPQGWTGMLQLYRARTEEPASAEEAI